MYSQISIYMLHATICELCINCTFLFEKLHLRMMKLVSRCYQHEFVSVDNKSITLSDMTLIVVRILAVIHFLSDRQIAMPWIFESATQSKYCSGEHYFLGSRVNGHLCDEEKQLSFWKEQKGRIRAREMHTNVELEKKLMDLTVINGENSDDSSEYE